MSKKRVLVSLGLGLTAGSLALVSMALHIETQMTIFTLISFFVSIIIYTYPGWDDRG